MHKLASIAMMLAIVGCSTAPTSYINVATGVDANGNVIFERYPISNRTAPASGAASLSDGPCLNRECMR